MKLYLDTEFNGHGGELISMALVSPEGHQWYAAKKLCSPQYPIALPWVAENVMPKLEVEQLPLRAFRASFHKFIVQFKEPTIICDWHADVMHFCEIIHDESYETSLDFPCQFIVLKTPPAPNGPIPENPHNALSDAIALMKWHQKLTGETK